MGIIEGSLDRQYEERKKIFAKYPEDRETIDFIKTYQAFKDTCILRPEQLNFLFSELKSQEEKEKEKIYKAFERQKILTNNEREKK